MSSVLGYVIGHLMHLASQLVQLIHHVLTRRYGAIGLFRMMADLLDLADHPLQRL